MQFVLASAVHGRCPKFKGASAWDMQGTAGLSRCPSTPVSLQLPLFSVGAHSEPMPSHTMHGDTALHCSGENGNAAA
eukprot:4864824-Pleurochrysis_carterae.AAC.1